MQGEIYNQNYGSFWNKKVLSFRQKEDTKVINQG